MTDAERWREVAAWFEEAAETGDCSVGPHYRLAWPLYENLTGFATRITDYGCRQRATLALLMAHMAEDDGGNHRNEENAS